LAGSYSIVQITCPTESFGRQEAAFVKYYFYNGVSKRDPRHHLAASYLCLGGSSSCCDLTGALAACRRNLLPSVQQMRSSSRCPRPHDVTGSSPNKGQPPGYGAELLTADNQVVFGCPTSGRQRPLRAPPVTVVPGYSHPPNNTSFLYVFLTVKSSSTCMLSQSSNIAPDSPSSSAPHPSETAVCPCAPCLFLPK